MLLTRPFAHRRATLLGLVGAFLLVTFFVLPQGQAAAAALLTLFRGEKVQAVTTDYDSLKNLTQVVNDLDELGSLQGSLPTTLTDVSTVSAASSTAGFSVAQPANLPNGINRTPTNVKALAPREIVVTFDKAEADDYFKNKGSSTRMPGNLNGAQLIIQAPGVAVVEYRGNGSRVYVGQAGQLEVTISGNAKAEQVKSFLLDLPGLSSQTRSMLQNVQNWQTTIPLAIPTDKVGWQPTSVSGGFAGQGVLLNDNSGIGSAIVWQTSDGKRSIGVAGTGLKASDLQNVASSLR